MTPGIKADIAREISTAMRHLGAKSDLIGIINSYGDTMPDIWVLHALRQWNEHRSDHAEQIERQEE
jgi:hypothetical protein